MREVVERHESYNIEVREDGLTVLAVTGPFPEAARDALRSGRVQGLSLSYVSGFTERNLEFIEDWPISWFFLIDRRLQDVTPVQRLRSSLTDMELEAAPQARLDLSGFDKLEGLGTQWRHVGRTIAGATALKSLVLWVYGEEDLTPLAPLDELRLLRITGSRKLASLEGVQCMPHLETLWVQGAHKLDDIDAVGSLAPHLTELRLEACRAINSLAPLNGLSRLRLLEIGDCGEIESLAPLESLHELEYLLAWGDTKTVDNDLTVLQRLPRLRELRMVNRRAYRPPVHQIDASID